MNAHRPITRLLVNAGLAQSPSASAPRRTSSSAPKGSTAAPRKSPVPSKAYLDIANNACSLTYASCPPEVPPLLVLDLNGVLVYRSKNRNKTQASITPQLRPYLASFLQYIFGEVGTSDRRRRRFEVMIWSSAQPHNVAAMVKAAGFDVNEDSVGATAASIAAQTPPAEAQASEQLERKLDALSIGDLIRKPRAIWTRADMDLGQGYSHKVQTYKDLAKVWKRLRPVPSGDATSSSWNARNTLLVDDSTEKAAMQPFNHIHIEEYRGQRDASLLSLIDVLDAVSQRDNFAAFIKKGGLAELGLGSAKSIERGRKLCEALGIPVVKDTA